MKPQKDTAQKIIRFIARLLVLIDMSLVLMLPGAAILVALFWAMGSTTTYISNIIIGSINLDINIDAVAIIALCTVVLVGVLILVRVVPFLSRIISAIRNKFKDIYSKDWMSAEDTENILTKSPLHSKSSPPSIRVTPKPEEARNRFSLRAAFIISLWILQFFIRLLTRLIVPSVAMFLVWISVPLGKRLVEFGKEYIVVSMCDGLQRDTDADALKIALFIVVGLAGSTILVKCTKAIRKSLVAFGKTIIGVFRHKWKPNVTIRTSLVETWDQIVSTVESLGKLLKSSVVVLLSLLLTTILFVLSYEQSKEVVCWQRNIVTELNNIKGLHEGDGVSTGEDVPVVYSLVYRKQGNLGSMDGICPSDQHVIDWINMFKKAIASCGASSSGLTLEVRGFASIAPIEVPASIELAREHYSSWYNIEVANLRSRVIARMLTADGDIDFEACKNMLSVDNQQEENKDGLRVNVEYLVWPNYGTMMNKRPGYDGRPGERVRLAELFNRTVQIIVKDDLCWRREWLEGVR